jgi:hypothetical protein
MTPAEGETAILGGVAIIGTVIAVAREAVRRNWVAFTVSLSVTKPDARWPKFPAPKAQSQPEPAPPLGEQLPVPADGRPAGATLTAAGASSEARRQEYARRRANGMTTTEVAVALGLRGGTRSRYERRYQDDLNGQRPGMREGA